MNTNQNETGSLADIHTQEIAAPSLDVAALHSTVPDGYVFDHSDVVVKPKRGLFGLGQRDGVWRCVAYRKDGPSYWKRTYRQFLRGTVAGEVVDAARQMRDCLVGRTESSRLLLDLLKPQVAAAAAPRTGPTGNPLLDLTDGRPDTPQAIAFNLIVDQENPCYEEYLSWAERNARLYDKRWVCMILDYLSESSLHETVRRQSRALSQRIGRMVFSAHPEHLSLLKLTAEATTAAFATADSRQTYYQQQQRYLGTGTPPLHQRAWWALLEGGTPPDISGGVFDNLIIDVSLKGVRAVSASFRNCIFLRGHFDGAVLDDSDFTNSRFVDVYIQSASVRRANFTDAYIEDQVYCPRATGLNEAIVKGLRLAEGKARDSFLAQLTESQKASLKVVPGIGLAYQLRTGKMS